MSPETIARIEHELAHWDDPDSQARKRFEEAEAEWDEKLRPLTDAIRASEHLTAEDFQIRFYPID